MIKFFKVFFLSNFFVFINFSELFLSLVYDWFIVLFFYVVVLLIMGVFFLILGDFESKIVVLKRWVFCVYYY